MRIASWVLGGIAAAGLAASSIGTAEAHWHHDHDGGPGFSFGIIVPPAYYAPPPGYYAAPPQGYYYVPPAPPAPPQPYYAPPPPPPPAPGLSFGITLPFGH